MEYNTATTHPQAVSLLNTLEEFLTPTLRVREVASTLALIVQTSLVRILYPHWLSAGGSKAVFCIEQGHHWHMIRQDWTGYEHISLRGDGDTHQESNSQIVHLPILNTKVSPWTQERRNYF